MTARPISLIYAAGLLILIGVSGMAVGGSLIGFTTEDPATIPTGPDLQRAAIALGVAIAAYGFATVFAGVGLILFRRWAWRLGVVTIVAGLVGLAGASAATGRPDPVLLFGIAFWGATLACLLVRPTRQAVGA